MKCRNTELRGEGRKEKDNMIELNLMGVQRNLKSVPPEVLNSYFGGLHQDRMVLNLVQQAQQNEN